MGASGFRECRSCLSCHLEGRFGPPSDQVRERVTQADPNTLLDWSDRILDASSIEEVLH